MKIKAAPIRFVTQFKDKIWGGSKIKDILGKDFSPLPNCGETWELSGVEGSISAVENGPYQGRLLSDLIEEFTVDLLGKTVFDKYGSNFPLLIKFIDARDDLSIQVHPNDQAASNYHSLGKTEMWYIIDSDPNARLVSGLKESVTIDGYTEAIKKGELASILKWVPVYPDDVFFIPAGKVHSIGKGILLAEIQQSSDLTFRIYDFDREDESGNKRELHSDEALDVIDFNSEKEPKRPYVDTLNEPVELVSCQYFTTRKLILDRMINHKLDHESFTIFICLEGESRLNGETFKKGEVLLLPAICDQINIDPTSKSTILEVFIE